MKFIKRFDEIRLGDTSLVGGKNAAIGQMIGELSQMGVRVPGGFAVTSEAYWHYLKHNDLTAQLKKGINALRDPHDIEALQQVGAHVRKMIAEATLPDDLAQEIGKAYEELSKRYEQADCDVAVRSSATAEDLPTASFAGQQETFLNVRGVDHLLTSYKKCLASLFTDRAIIYRIEQGFDHFQVAASVGVQKMVRTDLACAGVAFSIDTESGFKDVVTIDSSYGLGESIVQGIVNPDEFSVHKPTLELGYDSVIRKRCGSKDVKAVYGKNSDEPVVYEPVATDERLAFSLADEEILDLARTVVMIERHFSDERKRWMPLDIEWGKDGVDGKLYILQARPETVHGIKDEERLTISTYRVSPEEQESLESRTLLVGQSVGQQISHGIARVIEDASQIDRVQRGDIIVTGMTDPDWVPAMKRAAAIVTERGGRTCHAAIVSRELGIPAIVGAEGAMYTLSNDQAITVDCSRGTAGFVYEGTVPFEVDEVALDKVPAGPVSVMVNIANPDRAFSLSFLPVAGVGLARTEFVVANEIGIHPMALLHPEKVEDCRVREQIDWLTARYRHDKPQFFVDRLAQGIGTIAAAFYPRPVIARLCDFKTNEYRGLLGGTAFEPVEQNPMIGFRGAARYTHPLYREAFALECSAMKQAREKMGMKNLKIMVPFVRTIGEAEAVVREMADNGLVRGEDGLEIYMMCEIPSNVILSKQFSTLFDGFSIGSNDLTQLVLGVDRDSELLAGLFDERDPAVKEMLKLAIENARATRTPIGLCGQAPSDYPEMAEFLVECGIDSMSLNPDSVVPFLMRYA